MPDATFTPSVHGWPFPNQYRYPSHLLGLNRPLPESFGLCGGLCWSALDRFLAGRRIPRPRSAPAPGESLYAELILRQANVLAHDVWKRARAWQDGQKPGATGSKAAASRTRGEWKRLRRLLDAGEPALLCLVRGGGPVAAPADTHLVLACRYSLEGGNRRPRIWIYDPNHPDDDDRTLTLSLGSRGLPGAITLGDDQAILGFFVVPYDRARPLTLAAESFADRSRVTLARPITGRPSVLAGPDDRVDLLGSDAENDLVHYRREADGTWVYTNPTQQRNTGTEFRIFGQPAIAAGPGRDISVFGRTYVGDLIHYRRSARGGWRAHNLTQGRAIGLRFRVASDPVATAGSGRGMDVFATNADGHLIHYELSSLRRWTAADRTADLDTPERFALHGQPVAVVGPGGSRHVFGRSTAGRLVRYHRPANGPWAAEIVVSDRLAELRVAGSPAVVADDDAVHAFARDADGRLLHFEWRPGTGWTDRAVTPDAESDTPAAAADSDPTVVRDANGSIHVFARSRAGGLLHGCRAADGGWAVEDVTASRPAVGKDYQVDDAPVACAGPGRTLHVIAAGDGDLRLYRWTPDADWLAENVMADHPDIQQSCPDLTGLVPLTTADGHPHAFGVDANGAIAHLDLAPTSHTTLRHRIRALLARRRRPAAVVLDAPTATRRAPPRPLDPQEPVPDLPLLDTPDESRPRASEADALPTLPDADALPALPDAEGEDEEFVPVIELKESAIVEEAADTTPEDESESPGEPRLD